MNPSAAVAEPPGVVTVTLTAPAACAGDVAVIWVAESTVNTAEFDPNITVVAPVKLVPLMTTEVPPATGPEVGVKLVTAGAAAATYVNASGAAPVPLGVVTVTDTPPAACAGVVAVICVSESTVKTAEPELNMTLVAPVNPVPVITTDVPPAVGPEVGVKLVTVGVVAAT
jgi:hypothetical protein